MECLFPVSFLMICRFDINMCSNDWVDAPCTAGPAVSGLERRASGLCGDMLAFRLDYVQGPTQGAANAHS